MSKPVGPNWRRYLRFWRPNVPADVDDEFSFHIRERIDDLVARGMSPSAARDEALRVFGDLEHFRRECKTIAEEQEARMRFSEQLTVLRQDSGYALRVMRSNPVFTAAIVLTLALGIGATTSIFSVINAVLLRPLPFDNPDRLVWINETLNGGTGSISPGHYRTWSEQARSFEAMSIWSPNTVNITEGEPERVVAARVGPTYFNVIHMTPAAGRYFLPTETAASRVVVLSYPFWEARFAKDRGIVGKDMMLNGEAHTIIGVTPPEFTTTRFDERLWTLLTFTPRQLESFGDHGYQLMAKLKPGITLTQAREDIARITEDIRKAHPGDMTNRASIVELVTERAVRGFERQLWVLFGAVGFVLLIGCANVASLLLARSMSRRKEIAVRGALGGTRGRLVGQLLTESIVLAGVGGVVALGVAQLGVKFLTSMGPQGLPRLSQAGLDPVVLSFAAGLTVLSGVVFGLAPAFRATRVDLSSDLREGGRGTRAAVRDRLRSALIVTEFAVALVLLVSAGLFVRSAIRLNGVATGFDPSGVTMARVALPPARYDSFAVVNAAYQQLIASIRAIPGVERAGAGTRVPMWGGSVDFGVRVMGRPIKDIRAPEYFGHARLVTSDYFETLGMPIKRGRSLRESDLTLGAPWVIVVNEDFVRRTFPNEDPIGKRISGWTRDSFPEWREIVGVVANVRSFGREAEVPPEIYMPITQAPASAWNAFQRRMTIVAKSRLGSAIAPPIRAAVRRFDAQLPVFDVQTMDDVLSQSTATRRFNTMLLAMLGFTGLILAAIGIYGVIAFFVTQRTQEIGVRVALGATTTNVVSMVVRQALVLASLGIVAGGIAAWWGAKVLDRLLFETTSRDPVTFAAGAAVLLLVALGAAWIPARRAARVDPVMALASSG